MSDDKTKCGIITIAGQKIQLIAKGLICFFRIKSFTDALFLGKPIKAIDEIANQLGPAGQSVDATKALAKITAEVEQVVPPLSKLKSSKDVALTEISIIQKIDSSSFGIGIPVQDNVGKLGSAKIDGIGFRIEVTKIVQ